MHPYAVQTAALLVSLLIGAWWEQHRRRQAGAGRAAGMSPAFVAEYILVD